MTTLRETVKQLGLEDEYSFFSDEWDIDVGDYSFSETKKIGPDVRVFIDEENPSVRLVFNRNKRTLILYILVGDETVEATVWRMGKKLTRNLLKSQINNEIFGEVNGNE
ncbi:MAG: hypothetical protein BZ138_07910 [Methanosphaera sp. rholeuAM270]|nr:MAG: hypothetical protein BZ138_07910 [Methanosphaera sp. rholeuAM270]